MTKFAAVRNEGAMIVQHILRVACESALELLYTISYRLTASSTGLKDQILSLTKAYLPNQGFPTLRHTQWLERATTSAARSPARYGVQ
jgi:hypothetical protein